MLIENPATTDAMWDDCVTVWTPKQLDGLVVLRARFDEQRFPRHVHEEHVIGVNIGGAHSFYCRGGTHVVPSGSIALINPDEVHTGEAAGAGEWNYCGFYPRTELLQSLYAESMDSAATRPLVFDRLVVENPLMAQRLIAAATMSEADDGALAQESQLIEVLTDLIRLHAAPRRRSTIAATNSKAARVAREYIHAHTFESITLSQLANVGQIGRSSVIRAFRREYGMAPYEYLVALRVAHARRLLERGIAPVQVALICGFTDQSHLNRHFRRVVGVPPGAYGRAVSAPRVAPRRSPSRRWLEAGGAAPI